MSDQLLFILGVVITVVTVGAILLVGQSEAEDPAHNRVSRGADAL